MIDDLPRVLEFYWNTFYCTCMCVNVNYSMCACWQYNQSVLRRRHNVHENSIAVVCESNSVLVLLRTDRVMYDCSFDCVCVCVIVGAGLEQLKGHTWGKRCERNYRGWKQA